MRILQVCNKPPFPVHDGGSLAMFNLAVSLKKAGHHIEVLTMVTNKHKLSDESFKNFSHIMPVYPVFVDTRLYATAFLQNLLFSRLPYNASRFISEEFSLKLRKLVSENNYDVIQLEGLYLIPYIADIKQKCRSLIAYRAHNVEFEIWERIARQENNPFKKAYLRLLAGRIRQMEIKTMNCYDLLVPITWRDEKKFSEMGNLKPSLVCQAGFELFNPPRKIEGKPSFYFLGSLDWIPNQEGLLWFIKNIMPPLQSKYADFTFHIAGRNAPEKLIKEITGRGVIYHGEINDASAFAGQHNVLLAPCFSGSGMRVKIIEAMANGKVVITTTIGAEGIPVKHNVNILIADTIDEFIASVERLMNNNHLCLEIGLEACRFAQFNYSSVNIALQLVNFYNHHLK